MSHQPDKHIQSDQPAPSTPAEQEKEKQQTPPPEKETPETGQQGLTKEELPDATNESTGIIGSGQRQDSN
ncbi:hypothetical protein KTO58_03125 [Chitinophaga pendula]|uniref:hypothetical protein n=1 Tax=Chitinophaga TaxID=79328 RepID=UPI000BB0B1C1|nr:MULTISPECIES: hypothetical protein [Chitinophaga]ASZ14173.1 hypothetical protein CK934_26095 [Chitinophaga sp. MD30]UCJ08191.1 hypothetical protein KTO58_03125 [Chitinophaga pendula]